MADDDEPQMFQSEQPDEQTPQRVHRRGLKRAVAACQRCRRRKQKCDGKLPICGQCLTAKATCVPSDRFIVRPDLDSECHHLRSQVWSLEAQVETLQSQLNTIQAQGSNPDTSAALASTTIRDDFVPRPDATPQSNLEGFYSGRMLLPTFPRIGSSEAPDAPFLSSPWRLWDGLPNEDGPDLTRNSSQHIQLDQVGRELVDVFFARRWPQFPVIHKPTFLEKHFLPFSRGEPCDKLSCFQVNMVLAIGASEKDPLASLGQGSHHRFFQSAIRSLGDVLGADDLDCIQCLLLLCIFGSNEPQSVNLWYTVGLALRLAIGINLHRRETVASRGLLEAEMCKRLFWSVYIMDRSISISMGRPLGIQDSDITMPLPLCLSDDMLLQQFDQPYGGLVPATNDLSTFLHIIELRRINGDIYKKFHSAGETSLADDGIDLLQAQFYTRLNQWLVTAPRYLVPTSMNQMPEWFQIAYHQAIMNLYRPSHASPVSTLYSIRLCADSAISLINSYSSLYAKNKITYTFVGLTSLFMAAVTMLFSLRASPTLRQELTREIVESNIRMCCTLLRDVSNGRSVGEKSALIIQKLGSATLAAFDTASGLTEGEVDTEFMSWFGLKSQQRAPEPGQQEQLTPSVDLAWNDLFENGFDFEAAFCSDVLL